MAWESMNKVTRLRPYHGAINKSQATTNKEQANKSATGKKKGSFACTAKEMLSLVQEMQVQCVFVCPEVKV
jgi:hypothetical protein